MVCCAHDEILLPEQPMIAGTGNAEPAMTNSGSAHSMKKKDCQNASDFPSNGMQKESVWELVPLANVYVTSEEDVGALGNSRRYHE